MAQPASHVDQPDRRPRDRYVDEVCPALRDTLLHAIEQGGFSHKTRVLFAVLYLSAGYSRCSDAVFAAQIAALVKIPGDENERKTRSFLRELAREGVITWEPKPGRSKRSEVGLRRPSINRPLLTLASQGKDPFGGLKTARLAVGKPAVPRAPTEGSRGKTSESPAAAEVGDQAAHACDRRPLESPEIINQESESFDCLFAGPPRLYVVRYLRTTPGQPDTSVQETLPSYAAADERVAELEATEGTFEITAWRA